RRRPAGADPATDPQGAARGGDPSQFGYEKVPTRGWDPYGNPERRLGRKLGLHTDHRGRNQAARDRAEAGDRPAPDLLRRDRRRAGGVHGAAAQYQRGDRGPEGRVAPVRLGEAAMAAEGQGAEDRPGAADGREAQIRRAAPRP